MPKFVTLAAGAALIGTGLFLEFVTFGASTPLTAFLISAGAGMVISGIGTLLSGNAIATRSTAARDPIAPWNVVYGRSRVGGTLLYFGQFVIGGDYWLDMVLVLACHPCEAVDSLLFDGQRIQLSSSGGSWNGTSGDSFTPVQQTVSIFHISRTNNVVTVVLHANIPLLQAGDRISIQNVTGDYTLNGTYPVEQIISQVVGGPGSITFTYICGGAPAIVDAEGQCLTTWPDYGKKVHMEVCLGDHTETFYGMLHGTPKDNDSGDTVTYSGNPWTASHLCLGRTVVFLRLHYNDQYFANGLPTISFIVRGKKDVTDPRTSPATVGYSENAALCIADFLSDATIGFGAPYGTEIPYPELIAAANICDEPVDLANGGTEPRYACNGGFTLASSKGEILQNLLTSCAGRISYAGGQFVIYPAVWPGISLNIVPTSQDQA